MKAKAHKIDEIVPALEHGYACPHRESCRKKIIEQINLTRLNTRTGALTAAHIFTKKCRGRLCAIPIGMKEIYAAFAKEKARGGRRKKKNEHDQSRAP